MNLARASSILTLATVVLSIVGYAAAERFWLLAFAAVPVAVLGWWFTGVKGYRPLGKFLTNALVLAAIAWSAHRVTTTGGGQGLAVSIFSEFLVAIVLVKLWDHRQARDVAQILTLSIFLAIGSILTNNSLIVAVLLALNVAVLTAAVMSFHIAAGLERAGGSGAGEGRRAGMAFTTTAAAAFVAGLTASVGVWLLMPRGTGFGEWGGHLGEVTGGRRTGFADRVDLRRTGLISESQRAVMEVRFEDPRNRGRSIGAEGRYFYLRGAVLDDYVRGAWTSRADPEREIQFEQVQAHKWVFLGGPRRPEVEQSVVVRDSGTGPTPVMCMLDPVAVRFDAETAKFRFARESTRILSREGRAGRFSYTVRSDQPEMPDDPESISRRTVAGFPSEKVHQQAADALATRGLSDDPSVRPPSEDFAACRTIEQFLRTNFTYTLDPPVGSVEADPVESFLLETRSGHCEYFASAMAAMCRSVGISARVIAGYVAGEYHEDEGKYIVRESNAHAWVEAETSAGVWMTFDPTPQASLHDAMQPRETLLARWTRWTDWMDDLWAVSVVSFDESSRKRLLGADLNPTARIQDWMYSLYFRFRGRAMSDGVAFLFSLLVVGGGSAAAIVALVGIARRCARWLAGRVRRARGRSADPQLARVLAQGAFYTDLLRALDRLGMPKPPWKSPLEHAESLRLHRPSIYDPVRKAVETYYRLRFGRTDLTAEELRLAQAAVAAVRAAGRTRPAPA